MNASTLDAHNGDSGGNHMKTRALVVALVATLLALTSTSPASAVIGGSDFPSTTWVKSAMKGKGSWYRESASPAYVGREVGTSPSRCRLTNYFGQYQEAKRTFYSGPIRGSRDYGTTDVTVHRYRSVKQAQATLQRLGTYARNCSRTEEWVCANCDGTWTASRTPATRRKIGDQSVAWREKRVGMGVTSARMITARRGATVVLVSVERASDPETMRTPKYPTWKLTEKVTRKALAAAA